MIGSNMAQTAIMMHLTPNICLYDPYAPGLEGVAEEMFHCGFEGLNLTFTSDIKEALTDAKYVVSSGGAARKAGMTREDLLKGNAAIAEEFGKNVKAYCPDVKHVVVIFNPADITGLITLLYSGLKPSQVTTLAALDSTRLRSGLSKRQVLPIKIETLPYITAGKTNGRICLYRQSGWKTVAGHHRHSRPDKGTMGRDTNQSYQRRR